MAGAGNRAKRGQRMLGRTLQSWTQSLASCFGPFWLKPALAWCNPELSALEGLSGVPVWRGGASRRSQCRAGGAAGRSRAGVGAAALSAASATGSSAPRPARPRSVQRADLQSHFSLQICQPPPRVE